MADKVLLQTEPSLPTAERLVAETPWASVAAGIPAGWRAACCSAPGPAASPRLAAAGFFFLLGGDTALTTQVGPENSHLGRISRWPNQVPEDTSDTQGRSSVVHAESAARECVGSCFAHQGGGGGDAPRSKRHLRHQGGEDAPAYSSFWARSMLSSTAWAAARKAATASSTMALAALPVSLASAPPAPACLHMKRNNGYTSIRL